MGREFLPLSFSLSSPLFFLRSLTWRRTPPLGSLRKEGMSQEEVDHLFNAIVLPNFSYALPVYGASDSDVSVIQNFLDQCMKRKFMSKNVNIRDLLEKADKTLQKKIE